MIESDGAAITRLDWATGPSETDDPVLKQAAQQLQEYFDGTRGVFDLPLAPDVSGLTTRVLAVMQAIPLGDTRTYGDIARELDAPAQAIGQACGANPIPVIIPCHRVLGANGLGGFSGAGGVETKVALLCHEGAAGLLI